MQLLALPHPPQLKAAWARSSQSTSFSARACDAAMRLTSMFTRASLLRCDVCTA